MRAECAVRTEHLGKSFGKMTVLADLNLELRAGRRDLAEG